MARQGKGAAAFGKRGRGASVGGGTQSDPARTSGAILSVEAPGQRLSLLVGAVVFGRFVVSLLDAAKAFLLVRLLTKGDFGSYSLLSTLLATAVGIGAFALPDGMLYFLPRLEAGAQRAYVRQAMAILAAIGLVLGLGFLALSTLPELQPAGHGSLEVPLRLLAVAVALELPAQVGTRFLIGLGQHRVSAIQGMLLSLASNVAVLLTAAAGGGLDALLQVTALTALGRLLVMEVLVRRSFVGIAPTESGQGVRAQLAYALPLWLTSATGVINKHVSTTTLGYLLPAAVFADYAVGGQELPFVTMLAYSVATAMAPTFSGLYAAAADKVVGTREVLKLWQQGIDKVAAVMLPVFVFCMVLAEPLIALLYGDRFVGAVAPFRVFLLLLPLRVTAYGIVPMALGQPRAVLQAQLAGAVCNAAVLGGLALTLAGRGADQPAAAVDHRVAMVVAAMGSVLAQVVVIGWLLRTIGRAAVLPWHRVFPLRSYGVRVGCALAAGAVLLLPWPEPPETAGMRALLLLAEAAAYLACYLALGAHFGAITAEDRRYLWRWLRLEPLWRKE